MTMKMNMVTLIRRSTLKVHTKARIDISKFTLYIIVVDNGTLLDIYCSISLVSYLHFLHYLQMILFVLNYALDLFRRCVYDTLYRVESQNVGPAAKGNEREHKQVSILYYGSRHKRAE